jgi:hypothetical protein
MASSHARRGSDISLVARLGECRATSRTKNHGLVWLCSILNAGQVLQWLSARDGAQDRDKEDRAENTQDDIAQETTATTLQVPGLRHAAGHQA